jgi:hypothetical protein
MKKYREKRNNSSDNTRAASSQTAPKVTAIGYINLGLPSEYNVDDDDMLWPSGESGGQTVEEEYRSYAFGARAEGEFLGVDLLKFWEVCRHST